MKFNSLITISFFLLIQLLMIQISPITFSHTISKTSINKGLMENNNPTILDLTMNNSHTIANLFNQSKIIASDSDYGDHFGCDVDIFNNSIIVGARGDDKSRGSAYIFTCSNTIWEQEVKLTANDRSIYDYFGLSVSLNEDIALIGAEGDNDHKGSAYIFVKSNNTWTQQAKLIANDGISGDRFGYDLCLHRNIAFISAFGDNNGKGAVYVFKEINNSWIQQTKIIAPDGQPGDNFGFSIFVDDDELVIGAVGDDCFGGSAYIYEYLDDQWFFKQKITDNEGEFYDRFGFSVTMDSDTVFIGSESDYDHKGSVSIFNKNIDKWDQIDKLCDIDGESFDYFSYSMSIEGKLAFIGSFGDDGYRGSVTFLSHVHNNWIQQSKINAFDGVKDDFFGCSVSQSSSTLIIGAYGDDGGKGSAYIFLNTNKAPDRPSIEGRVLGKINNEYEYRIISNDPEKAEVYYIIDWGDNSFKEYIGPFPSGEEQIISHFWLDGGEYTIRVKSEDIYGAESEWSDPLTVKMPKPKGLHFFFNRFFENHPNLYSILQRIFEL